MNDNDEGARVATSFDGLPLHFTVRGAGEPVLMLIHGWSCSQEFWLDQLEAFATLTRVVTIDLAGHGCSRADVRDRVWSLQSFAGDVECIAAAVGAAELVFVGHSMGGPVALESALRVGARCRFVLGVDTFTDAAFYGRQTAEVIARRIKPFAADFPRAMTRMIENITAPGCDPALRARIAAAMCATDVLLKWDCAARWPLLRAPVATINSTLLARTSAALSLPGLLLRELDGVGHFPMLEDPRRFNALARALLEPWVRRAS
jgi:pimeloyl-ACP methyl ester carboxylesterase